jgi:hypothetical protein
MNRDEIIIHILEQKYNILRDSVEATMRNVAITDPKGAEMLVGEINQRVFEAEVRLAGAHFLDGAISGFQCIEDEIDEGVRANTTKQAKYHARSRRNAKLWHNRKPYHRTKQHRRSHR